MSATKRPYVPDFIELGFTHIEDKGVVKPQCILCSAVLCNESLKKSKLQDHMKRKHPTLLSKPPSYFQRLEGIIKKQRLTNMDSKVINQKGKIR